MRRRAKDHIALRPVRKLTERLHQGAEIGLHPAERGVGMNIGVDTDLHGVLSMPAVAEAPSAARIAAPWRSRVSSPYWARTSSPRARPSAIPNSGFSSTVRIAS